MLFCLSVSLLLLSDSAKSPKCIDVMRESISYNKLTSREYKEYDDHFNLVKSEYIYYGEKEPTSKIDKYINDYDSLGKFIRQTYYHDSFKRISYFNKEGKYKRIETFDPDSNVLVFYNDFNNRGYSTHYFYQNTSTNIRTNITTNYINDSLVSYTLKEFEERKIEEKYFYNKLNLLVKTEKKRSDESDTEIIFFEYDDLARLKSKREKKYNTFYSYNKEGKLEYERKIYLYDGSYTDSKFEYNGFGQKNRQTNGTFYLPENIYLTYTKEERIYHANGHIMMYPNFRTKKMGFYK